MPRSISFMGRVTTFGSARTHVEIPIDARMIIPKGRYQITLSALGTIANNDNPTE